MKRKKNKHKREQKWNLSPQGDSLFECLRGESERTHVLIATTFLDKGLEECLRLRFEKENVDNDLVKKLFDQNSGLLFNFGAKIWVARAFGFIDQETYLALDAVRKVRNACAHKNFKITLCHSDLQKEMKCLHEYVSTKWFGKGWEGTAPARLEQSDVLISGRPHLYFLLAAMQLFTLLSLTEYDLKRGSY